MDAICIGELLIDFTPEAGCDVFRRNPGGAPANVAVAMARAGIETGFIGKVGADAFGDFLVDALKREGIRYLCRNRAASIPTTMVFVSLAPDGEREFTFVRKPGADLLLDAEDIAEQEIAKAKLIHIGSVSMTDEPSRGAIFRSLEIARKLGKLVCFDVNYRESIWRSREEAQECIRKALKYVDLLKLSDEEAELLCGDASPAAMLDTYDLCAVIVTHGAKGAHCYIRSGSYEVPTVAQRAVDATGAGDAFWGNLLASLLRDGVTEVGQIDETRMLRAMRLGNAAGGYCVQHMGAIPSMPRLQELTDCL